MGTSCFRSTVRGSGHVCGLDTRLTAAAVAPRLLFMSSHTDPEPFAKVKRQLLTRIILEIANIACARAVTSNERIDFDIKMQCYRFYLHTTILVDEVMCIYV